MEPEEEIYRYNRQTRMLPIVVTMYQISSRNVSRISVKDADWIKRLKAIAQFRNMAEIVRGRVVAADDRHTVVALVRSIGVPVSVAHALGWPTILMYKNAIATLAANTYATIAESSALTSSTNLKNHAQVLKSRLESYVDYLNALP